MESLESGDNWSPKRIGSGNPSDPKPKKEFRNMIELVLMHPLNFSMINLNGDKLAGIGGVVGGITALLC